MHSSGMRTARLMSVYPRVYLPGGGVPAHGGVPTHGGVPAGG